MDAEVGDSGNYTCHAKTRLDVASTNSAKVQVYHRTKLLSPPSQVSSVISGKAELTCSMRVDPALMSDADIYWTINYQSTSRKYLGKFSFFILH